MACTLKGIVRYDGTEFAGWQKQPRERTVQGVLEEALTRIAGEAVPIHGAGRTDSGVHALAQVFSCRWPGDAPPDRLAHSLSSMLGPEIRFESIETVEDDFHARYSATGKRYAYVFDAGAEPDPFAHRYAWHIPRNVARARVAELAQCLVGEHDFAGFCGGGSGAKTTVRCIHAIELCAGGIVGPDGTGALWRLEFHGNGFLYKMIRNITGTLIDIARGKLPEARLDELLASPGPFQGHTAPGHGLFMVEVIYEPDSC